LGKINPERRKAGLVHLVKQVKNKDLVNEKNGQKTLMPCAKDGQFREFFDEK
jgi:hypothetical protein